MFFCIFDVIADNYLNYIFNLNYILLFIPDISIPFLFCIKEVRILELNIPHSKNVIKYEHFINTHYKMQTEAMDHWEEWKRPPEIEEVVQTILKENHIG